jgi:hypothetical protein
MSHGVYAIDQELDRRGRVGGFLARVLDACGEARQVRAGPFGAPRTVQLPVGSRTI